jgi:hypothetical protein
VIRRGFEGRIGPAGFFVLRTPILPIETTFGSIAGGGHVGSSRPPEQPRSDDVSVALRLGRALERRDVMEALYVASRDLCEAIPRWVANPKDKDGKRIERSVFRYMSRMVSRATPFGLFALG